MASRSDIEEPIVVIGLGAVASLGLDARTLFAAARAGLLRAGELSGVRLRSEVSGRPEPVIAHAVPLIADGFEGRARVLRLLQGALADLADGTPVVNDPELRCALYLALRAAATGEAGAAQRPAASIGEADVARIAALANDWAGYLRLAGVVSAGHCAGVAALTAALADLRAGRCAVAIVAAADSLLDEDTIAQLDAGGRLKCDGAPAGLQPGEASVAIALCSAETAARLGAAAQARIVSARQGQEPRDRAGGEVSVGVALAALLAQAGAELPQAASWLIADLNGETYRANEFGHALVRLAAAQPAFAEADTWMPAASFGDTGAASALLAVGMCMRAFERGYAPAPAALIASAADDRARGVIALAR